MQNSTKFPNVFNRSQAGISEPVWNSTGASLKTVLEDWKGQELHSVRGNAERYHPTVELPILTQLGSVRDKFIYLKSVQTRINI